jgi:hypothetical protein
MLTLSKRFAKYFFAAPVTSGSIIVLLCIDFGNVPSRGNTIREDRHLCGTPYMESNEMSAIAIANFHLSNPGVPKH